MLTSPHKDAVDIQSVESIVIKSDLPGGGWGIQAAAVEDINADNMYVIGFYVGESYEGTYRTPFQFERVFNFKGFKFVSLDEEKILGEVGIELASMANESCVWPNAMMIDIDNQLALITTGEVILANQEFLTYYGDGYSHRIGVDGAHRLSMLRLGDNISTDELTRLVQYTDGLIAFGKQNKGAFDKRLKDAIHAKYNPKHFKHAFELFQDYHFIQLITFNPYIRQWLLSHYKKAEPGFCNIMEWAFKRILKQPKYVSYKKVADFEATLLDQIITANDGLPAIRDWQAIMNHLSQHKICLAPEGFDCASFRDRQLVGRLADIFHVAANFLADVFNPILLKLECLYRFWVDFDGDLHATKEGRDDPALYSESFMDVYAVIMDSMKPWVKTQEEIKAYEKCEAFMGSVRQRIKDLAFPTHQGVLRFYRAVAETLKSFAHKKLDLASLNELAASLPAYTGCNVKWASTVLNDPAEIDSLAERITSVMAEAKANDCLAQMSVFKLTETSVEEPKNASMP